VQEWQGPQQSWNVLDQVWPGMGQGQSAGCCLSLPWAFLAILPLLTAVYYWLRKSSPKAVIVCILYVTQFANVRREVSQSAGCLTTEWHPQITLCSCGIHSCPPPSARCHGVAFTNAPPPRVVLVWH
jgi:hypothetical protein